MSTHASRKRPRISRRKDDVDAGRAPADGQDGRRRRRQTLSSPGLTLDLSARLAETGVEKLRTEGLGYFGVHLLPSSGPTGVLLTGASYVTPEAARAPPVSAAVAVQRRDPYPPPPTSQGWDREMRREWLAGNLRAARPPRRGSPTWLVGGSTGLLRHLALVSGLVDGVDRSDVIAKHYLRMTYRSGDTAEVLAPMMEALFEAVCPTHLRAAVLAHPDFRFAAVCGRMPPGLARLPDAAVWPLGVGAALLHVLVRPGLGLSSLVKRVCFVSQGSGTGSDAAGAPPWLRCAVAELDSGASEGWECRPGGFGVSEGGENRGREGEPPSPSLDLAPCPNIEFRRLTPENLLGVMRATTAVPFVTRRIVNRAGGCGPGCLGAVDLSGQSAAAGGRSGSVKSAATCKCAVPGAGSGWLVDGGVRDYQLGLSVCAQRGAPPALLVSDRPARDVTNRPTTAETSTSTTTTATSARPTAPDPPAASWFDALPWIGGRLPLPCPVRGPASGWDLRLANCSVARPSAALAAGLPTGRLPSVGDWFRPEYVADPALRRAHWRAAAAAGRAAWEGAGGGGGGARGLAGAGAGAGAGVADGEGRRNAKFVRRVARKRDRAASARAMPRQAS